MILLYYISYINIKPNANIQEHSYGYLYFQL